MIVGYSRASNVVATDPNFSSVVLLMGFEGSNLDTGTPGMDDESSFARGTASGGSASSNISTTSSKFGAAALHLNGNHIHFPDSNDFNLAAGHFTVETFINPDAVSVQQFIVGQWNSAGNLGWILWCDSASLSWYVSTTGSNTLPDMVGGTLAATTWQHVAADYDGTKYRLYLNGVMVASSVTARTIFNSPDELSIGAAQNGAFNFDGYIDELRITKGVARYASDGGFTVPASAFPRS